MGHVRGVSVRRGVLVRVGDHCVFRPMRGATLLVVFFVPGTAAPGSDADVGLPVREAADKGFEFGVLFDGADADDFSLLVCEDGAAEIFLYMLGRFGPGGAEVLHEEGVTLAG